MKFTAALLLLGYLIGNIQKWSFANQLARFSLLEIAVILFILFALPCKSFVSGNKWFLPFCLFSLISLLSLMLATGYGLRAQLTGLLYWFRWIVLGGIFTLSVGNLNISDRYKLLINITWITIVVCFVQYFFFPDIRPLVIYNWDPHYFRIVGSFLDPGFTGIILVFILLFITAYPEKFKNLPGIAWGLCYIALALTYSRSSYLAFLAAMGYLAYIRKSLRYFLFIVLLLALTIWLLPRASSGEGVRLERTSSIKARLDNWHHSLVIFRDHPVLGIGFNVYRYAQKEYGFITLDNWQNTHAGGGADSSLLFVAATTGLFGLVIYLWYLIELFRHLPPNHLLRSTLVALFFHSFFLNSLFYPFVLVWIAIIINLVDIPRPSLSLSGSRHYLQH
ncbi:MAG: hypothetical protein UX91_C0010G0020 [Candidatus Amesbacteria bacterium GW2011_GWB1_47_19]|nr:MAG: hypothetical protein UW51_C0010G0021 [Candidatus Amesbacteria bacterium GW2011_GWA1_44_24]KKU30882.1 MAG: hypothetical protein UX46_C0010G0020 [Candidatus Amesbacteria bacterium GW2011_GWC1_46_24]KKU66571.1 MAG: hypothetical protein UX91_C0010G0020 [Candidatus Amesbacteria bacterium GW2011_GWB1_47_19]OGD05871.1 MAG: hypothetical protein A2379_02070 [Candidatus Amesbacteria bacterium RIFOXYB1_FULL_47_13]HBC73066.1 hypothetical protein [Candidatus Amesbacteria bacterium]